MDARLKALAPLVRRLAHQLLARLPASVERDDLLQEGMVALWHCLGSFDPSRGVLFETFATQRIQGAMLDLLRAQDWMGRTRRRQMRRMDAAADAAAQRLGRPPRCGELAVELGMSLAGLHALRTLLAADVCALEDLHGALDADFLEQHMAVAAPPAEQPLEDAQDEQALQTALDRLPERERQVLDMQADGMVLRDIGRQMGVSESRASQLAAAAVGRLRKRLLTPERLAPPPVAPDPACWARANILAGWAD